ncbi:MAG: hypothetical protein DRI36_04890 [Caldiserica bacterium]|nr:MAG: hypothetical protein DRI36_04890 [Caldisericota bacterium]
MVLSFLIFFLYSKSFDFKLKNPSPCVIEFSQERVIFKDNYRIKSKGRIYYLEPFLIYEISKPSITIVYTQDYIYYFFHYLKRFDRKELHGEVSCWDVFIREFKKQDVRKKKIKNGYILTKKKGENFYKLKVVDGEVKSLKVRTPFEEISFKILSLKKKKLNRKFFRDKLKKLLDKYKR